VLIKDLVKVRDYILHGALGLGENPGFTTRPPLSAKYCSSRLNKIILWEGKNLNKKN